MSSTNKAKALQKSCKRKRTEEVSESQNDLHDSSPSFSAAGELYSNSSADSSHHKKRKVNDSCRFHQSDDEVSNGTCSDDVLLFKNHESLERHSDIDRIQTAGCAELAHVSGQPHVALTADKQQSSNFEELLFGLISENECSQVASPKTDSSCAVISTGSRVHKIDKRSSINDTSSDSSDADISDVVGRVGVNNQSSVEDSNARLAATSCLLSMCASNNYSNTSAADSKFHTIDNKSDLSQSQRKQNKDKKPEKMTLDCAKLCSKAECRERKPKQKKRHMFASVSLTPSQTFSNNENQFALLRKVHKTTNMHTAVCGKMSTQTTADVIHHCSELNASSIENMSSTEPGYCDMPESSKKHKKRAESKHVTNDCTELEITQLKCHKKKKCYEHASSSVDSICSSNDKSDFTPRKTNCEKKILSECSSPLAYASSSSVATRSPVMHYSIDRLKPSEQTAGVLIHSTLACDDNNSGNVLLENDSPQKCKAPSHKTVSVNKESEEDIFEQLLLDDLVVDKSSTVSHSHQEMNKGKDLELSSKEPGCEQALSESTTDDDEDDDDGDDDDEQDRILEIVSPVTDGAGSRDNCAENSGTKKETVTEEHVLTHDAATDNIQSCSFYSEDESQTSDFRRCLQTDRNVMSVDCDSYTDSLSLCTSGTTTEISHDPTSGAQCEVHLPTDVIVPPAQPDLSSPLSQSHSACDSVGESSLGQQLILEETTNSVAREINSGGVQLPSAQDIEHSQQEGQKDLLSEDSVCSDCEMSDENCVSVIEQNEPVTELRSDSAMLRLHTPASPPLFSADEEEEVCSVPIQAEEEESDVQSDEVSTK